MGVSLGAGGGYLVWLVQGSTPTRPAAEVAPPAEPPAVDPPRTSTEPDERSRFAFYTMLPEMEIHTDNGLADEPSAPPAEARSGPFVLQVGSFRRMDEADNLRARLALLGVEATIQPVVIRDRDIWYRVRVGPYTSARELDRTRARLQRHDIDALVLKLGT